MLKSEETSSIHAKINIMRSDTFFRENTVFSWTSISDFLFLEFYMNNSSIVFTYIYTYLQLMNLVLSINIWKCLFYSKYNSTFVCFLCLYMFSIVFLSIIQKCLLYYRYYVIFIFLSFHYHFYPSFSFFIISQVSYSFHVHLFYVLIGKYLKMNKIVWFLSPNFRTIIVGFFAKIKKNYIRILKENKYSNIKKYIKFTQKFSNRVL